MYQLDFLPIGKTMCGDAIVFRFGDLLSGDPTKQFVVLIDGGYQDDSKTTVQHIREYYNTNYIDLVVSTHPDQDHINGLPGVLEEIKVGKLWMHLPWQHSQALATSKVVGFSGNMRSNKLRASLQGASKLEQAARANKVPVIEQPFAGQTVFENEYGRLTVLGPSVEYYRSLLPAFLEPRIAPQQPSLRTSGSMLDGIYKAAQDVLEDHGYETLTNRGVTSPQNNSSTVMLFELFGSNPQKVLFTGDAGIEALEHAHEVYAALGHGPGELSVFQVPHHGSRKNVGPDILDKFLGQKLPDENIARGHAYVSVAPTCTQHNHPYKVVMNAVKRRGYPVYATAGINRLHYYGMDRRGWFPGLPLPFFSIVENDNE